MCRFLPLIERVKLRHKVSIWPQFYVNSNITDWSDAMLSLRQTLTHLRDCYISRLRSGWHFTTLFSLIFNFNMIFLYPNYRSMNLKGEKNFEEEMETYSTSTLLLNRWKWCVISSSWQCQKSIEHQRKNGLHRRRMNGTRGVKNEGELRICKKKMHTEKMLKRTEQK